MIEFRCNPEDLAKYDPEGKGEAGLRLAFERATVVGKLKNWEEQTGQRVCPEEARPDLFSLTGQNSDQPSQTDQPSDLNRS